MKFHFPSAFGIALGSMFLACGSGSDISRNPGGGAGSGPIGGGGSGVISGGVPMTDPSDTRALPVRKRMCDSMGQCSCLRLALLGTLDSAANTKDTQPFVDWLNGNSGGTATVTMISTKPAIDDAFLAGFDILVVANVNTWSFGAGEKAAVERWVRQSGGGIVTLTGFLSTDAEPAASSQLISFSGLGYQPPKTAVNGQSEPLYYKDGTVNLKNCLAWTQSSDAIITTPVRFTQEMGSMKKLTFGLDYVGAFEGWAVTAPAQATVIATDPVSGSTIAAALEVDGKGRLFAFGDEWVVFANQWLPKGDPPNRQMDMYNICWEAPSSSAPAFFQSVQTLYQTKQFWYDAINWVAPPNECNFTVTDPDVVVLK
jgi:hypothetical protein